jgi:hypothetical protein
MISNNPLFMRDQDHQAKHSDILAAARSATVTSPTIAWRTGDFDNLGGVAFERPAPSAPRPAPSARVSIYSDVWRILSERRLLEQILAAARS